MWTKIALKTFCTHTQPTEELYSKPVPCPYFTKNTLKTHSTLRAKLVMELLNQTNREKHAICYQTQTQTQKTRTFHSNTTLKPSHSHSLKLHNHSLWFFFFFWIFFFVISKVISKEFLENLFKIIIKTKVYNSNIKIIELKMYVL